MKYLAIDRLELNSATIETALNQIQQAMPQWKELIKRSFLSPQLQKEYLSVLDERCARLKI